MELNLPPEPRDIKELIVNIRQNLKCRKGSFLYNELWLYLAEVP